MDATSWQRGDWMQTYTGRKFYPMDPRPEDVDPVDIAHSLALQCRYNGHVDRFYSVAEHCILLSYAVHEHLALDALLHDATEAYVGDMIRPLKNHMPAYRYAEDRVAVAIAERFQGLLITLPSYTYEIPPEVKDADTRILLDERAALMPGNTNRWGIDDTHEPLGVEIHAWSPEEAKRRYLKRLDELLGTTTSAAPLDPEPWECVHARFAWPVGSPGGCIPAFAPRAGFSQDRADYSDGPTS